MSTPYDPASSAYANATDSIKLLSQRDLSLQVPIDFVPVTGVSLTSACFGKGRYEASAAARCISNLLVTGFRRFDLDLYWDSSRATWSFCPVQLGNENASVPLASSSAATPRTTSSAALNSVPLSRRDDAYTTEIEVEPRQFGSISASMAGTTRPTLNGTTLSAPSSTMTLGPQGVPTADASSQGDTLLDVGPYACSPGTNLTMFMDTLTGYLDETQNNLNATTTYITLNLHSAASASNPVGPANSVPQDKLPRGTQMLSSIVSEYAATYLYAPSDLQQQRNNLNATGSWFSIPLNVAPDPSYFNITQESDHASTSDGWPSESFIEFTKAKRLLVEFGSINSQLSGYNTTVDEATIFKSGFIKEIRPHTFSAFGSVQSGCFFNPGSTSLSSVNSSWAVAEVNSTGSLPAPQQAGSLSLCGITPLLNTTLGNATADVNPLPYHSFVMSTIWSWAAGEPRNSSGSGSETAYHCAALNSTSGTWQAEDCNTPHLGACRIGNQPYVWQIGSSSLIYDKVDQYCPYNSSFTVARTAMENAYLVSAWRQSRAANSVTDELLWLNFNDLDVPTCWVIGQNSTCPYQEADRGGQTIIVPTVAAVIVFVLTILTIFVKCAANRQSTRRKRRRGDDGWDYEGVPA